jgi:uncharacterized SAM-binding protein YcdF (DUF218 family)
VASVVCVLGCRSGSKTLERRARAAGEAFFARGASLVVACGGRAWDGRVEADELLRMLVEQGVPEDSIARERCSLDTLDNARFAAALLGRYGHDRSGDVLLVTCAWHLPRAKRLFERAGLSVEGLGVQPPDPGVLARTYWWGREAVVSWKDARRRVTL